MYRLLLLILVLAIPLSLNAEEDYINRRDGFMLIWGSIQRATYEPYKKNILDISESDYGYEEINFAVARGIIDETDYFRPNEKLNMEDALLWLFRSKNIRDLFYMQKANIRGMLRDYPIIEYRDDFADTFITSKDLQGLIYLLDSMLMKEIHEVSYYADDFHGKGTAFGDTFDMYDLTAAHRRYPSNTLIKVTNIDNRKSVIVRINDRGPYVEGRDMDLSLAAFEKIANKSQGVLFATFQRLGDEFMIDSCTENTIRFQKRITKNVRFHRGIPHIWNKGKTLYLGANRYFVVRSIQYPDGTIYKVQNWVGPKERFNFTPEQTGEYRFIIGNKKGNIREMRMMVRLCSVN